MTSGKKLTLAAVLTVAFAGAVQVQEEPEAQVAAQHQEETEPLSSVPVILPPL